MSKVVSWSDGILVEEKVEDTDVTDIPGIDDDDEDEDDEEEGDEDGDDDEVCCGGWSSCGWLITFAVSPAVPAPSVVTGGFRAVWSAGRG